jgi:hypothetical protein
MRVKTWGIFILLATATLLRAQEVINDTTAQQTRNAGNLHKACVLLHNDLQKDPLQYQANYFLASNYALMGMKDSAYYYLEAAVAIRESFDVLTNPDLICLIKGARWKNLERKIAKAYFKQHAAYDKEATLLLAEMQMFNKAYDWDIARLELITPPDSLLIRHYKHLKDSLNDITRHQLEKIIVTSGWPKSSAVGPEGVSTAYLILQLADDKQPLKQKRRTISYLHMLTSHYLTIPFLFNVL